MFDKTNEEVLEKIGHAQKERDKGNGSDTRGEETRFYEWSYRRKHGREKNKRKTKTDDVRLDDEIWLQKAQGGGSTVGEAAASDI